LESRRIEDLLLTKIASSQVPRLFPTRCGFAEWSAVSLKPDAAVGGARLRASEAIRASIPIPSTPDARTSDAKMPHPPRARTGKVLPAAKVGATPPEEMYNVGVAT